MQPPDMPEQHDPALPDAVWVMEPTGYGQFGVLGLYATAEAAFARWPGVWRPDTSGAEYRQGEPDLAMDPGGLRLHRMPVQR